MTKKSAPPPHLPDTRIYIYTQMKTITTAKLTVTQATEKRSLRVCVCVFFEENFIVELVSLKRRGEISELME